MGRGPTLRLALAAAIVSVALSGSAGAADAVRCGAARPRLDAIVSAEGLVIAPDGTIYFSQPFDASNARYLGRYLPPYDEPPEMQWVDLGGNAFGIAFDPARGTLYAGSRTLKKLLEVTLGAPPVVAVLADAEEGINGLTLDEDGAVYYSDQGGGNVFRVTAGGEKSRVTASPLTEPNGLAFGPDGRLYVVSWGTPQVTRLTLSNGVEASREVFATLPQPKADGIAFDAKGRAFVTASAILYELSPDGAVVTPLGRSAGANVEFGAGPLSCSDIYTAGGQGIRLFQHDTPGLDVPWHRTPPSPAAASKPAAKIAFPGQYAPRPPEWRFSPAPEACRRFPGEEIACLEFVAFDFGTLARYAPANKALQPPRPGERRVVFFGDSITDGWSMTGSFPGKPYVNRGIGSQTTSQMLLRFRPDVVALRPQVVVILAGTNDIAGNSGPVTLDVIEQNIETMTELAKLHGIRVVLSSVLPVSDDKKDDRGRPLLRTGNRPPEAIRALNAWMAGYAKRNGHVYLDYFSALADAGGALKADLSSDGLHPNAAGYAVMAPLAEKAIAKALARPRAPAGVKTAP